MAQDLTWVREEKEFSKSAVNLLGQIMYFKHEKNVFDQVTERKMAILFNKKDKNKLKFTSF